jgi:2'-5' RNA ligase
MGTRRVFIALELPKLLKQRVGEVPQTLRAQNARVRWVDPKRMHLTLLFAGEASDEQVDRLGQVVRKTAGEYEPLRLAIGGLGAFPNRRNPRVIWIGVTTSDALRSLHREIADVGEDAGLPRDPRQFAPHLTVGRVKFVDRHSPLITRLKSVTVETFNYTLDTLTLFESELKPEGPVYTPLVQERLRGAVG